MWIWAFALDQREPMRPHGAIPENLEFRVVRWPMACAGRVCYVLGKDLLRRRCATGASLLHHGRMIDKDTVVVDHQHGIAPCRQSAQVHLYGRCHGVLLDE